MEFQMHTTYDRPTMTIMARASRKTINQKRNRFFHKTIAAVAESPRYFIFILGQKHAQIYDKSSLTGGNCEQFRALLETATGKPIFPIK